jgi:hypothetical protein
MTWNYRIVRIDCGDEITYGIHEVYYDDGIPTSYTNNPVGCIGSNLEELNESFSHMSLAFNKPTLTERDFSDEVKNRG